MSGVKEEKEKGERTIAVTRYETNMSEVPSNSILPSFTDALDTL